MQTRRLPSGGRIDRSKPLSFSFNGHAYTGFAGDTLASALLANGIGVLARSFKYHRPRGIVGSGAEEPNALLQLGRGGRALPNQRATQVELHADLVAESVNCWPSPQFDVAAGMGLFAKLLPAGFYYKTFMWPRRWWDTYERFIRRAAGLGYSPRAPDPDYYEKTNVVCDVLVVGAGPAGITAALAAGKSGARVLLVDEQSEPGGTLLYREARIGSASGDDWLRESLAALRDLPEVTLLPRTTVFGYYSHNWLGMLERVTDHLPDTGGMQPRQRLWRVRTRRVILATGAIERPLVFCNNDRPGVMLASAVSNYIKRYAVRPGTRAVVFTNNDSAYQTALDLQQAGVGVAAVVDARDNPQGPAIEAVSAQQGIEIIRGAVVHDVLGGKRVAGVRIAALDAADATLSGDSRTLECDLVAVSGGWNPTVHLHAQSGARAVFDEQRGFFCPGSAGSGGMLSRRLQRPVWPQVEPGCGHGGGGRCRSCRGIQTRAEAHLQDRGNRTGGGAIAVVCACADPGVARAEAVRGLAERHHRRGPRARRPRGISLHRAHQTLHRPGVRHRPGQTRQY